MDEMKQMTYGEDLITWFGLGAQELLQVTVKTVEFFR